MRRHVDESTLSFTSLSPAKQLYEVSFDYTHITITCRLPRFSHLPNVSSVSNNNEHNFKLLSQMVANGDPFRSLPTILGCLVTVETKALLENTCLLFLSRAIFARAGRVTLKTGVYIAHQVINFSQYKFSVVKAGINFKNTPCRWQKYAVECCVGNKEQRAKRSNEG